MRPSCLYLEVLPWHEEIFPHWLRGLRQLGCSVDLYARPALHRRDVLGHCRLDGYRLLDLDDLPRGRADHDLVFVNSLLGPGFDARVPSSFRPLLGRLAELGRPSVSVIHEPAFWSGQYPVASFRERRRGGGGTLHLHRSGTLHRDPSAAKPGTWSSDGDRLRLRLDRVTEVFSSRDGGATFVGEEPGHRLWRLPPPAPTLAQHLASGRHRLFTLSPHGARYLRPLYGDVRWAHPVYFGDFPDAGRPEPRIVFPGAVDYSRKSFAALLAAAAEVRRLELPIYVVGGEREAAGFAVSPNVRRLRRDLERHGLRDVVRFTGPLPYRDYLDFVRRSAWVLPLVDETVESGAYSTKLSTAVALAIAFGVPMIASDRMAALYDLELPTSYPPPDLAAGLAAASAVSPASWADLRRRMLARRAALDRHNREALSQALAELI